MALPIGQQKAMNLRLKFSANKLAEKFKTMSEGEVLTHHEIAQLTGCDYRTPDYYACVTKAKKIVQRDTDVRVDNQPKVGYRIPTGIEQVKGGVKVIRSGVRRIGRGSKAIEQVSDARLPDLTERAIRDHTIQQIKYLKEISKTHARAIELTVGKPQTLPRPKQS